MPTVDLTTPYVPCAIEYEDADALEYLTRAPARFYRRIDGNLSLAIDMETKEVIGFRLEPWSRLRPTPPAS